MGNLLHYASQILHYISNKMKYVSSLRVAALAGNIMLRTLPEKIPINFPYNVSNMTYSHFFLSLAKVKELLITQLHNFSIYFINVWSFCVVYVT